VAREASWIEKLLPTRCRRHIPQGPASGGLSAFLPIIMSLVAFQYATRIELYQVIIEDPIDGCLIHKEQDVSFSHISMRVFY
jgi:hypothetical protein